MTSDAVVHPSVPMTRGSTVIDDRVRERLIERAALSAPGVVARRTLVPGGNLPAVHLAGQSGVDIQIAASWPVDSASVLEAARSAVIRELADSLGEHPERVDVTIARVESERTAAQVADAYAAGPPPDHVGAAHRRFAPQRAAAATYTGVFIAIVVIVLGAVAIRDALTPDAPWIATALDRIADVQWQWWTWPAAVATAIVGLVLLVAALKPRRRTHVSIGDHVWVPRGTERRWTDEENFGIDDSGSVR